jgi:hypothetical protein
VSRRVAGGTDRTGRPDELTACEPGALTVRGTDGLCAWGKSMSPNARPDISRTLRRCCRVSLAESISDADAGKGRRFDSWGLVLRTRIQRKTPTGCGAGILKDAGPGRRSSLRAALEPGLATFARAAGNPTGKCLNFCLILPNFCLILQSRLF